MRCWLLLAFSFTGRWGSISATIVCSRIGACTCRSGWSATFRHAWCLLSAGFAWAVGGDPPAAPPAFRRAAGTAQSAGDLPVGARRLAARRESPTRDGRSSGPLRRRTSRPLLHAAGEIGRLALDLRGARRSVLSRWPFHRLEQHREPARRRLAVRPEPARLECVRAHSGCLAYHVVGQLVGAHLWGYRSYETAENSRNNWFVALLTNGEGWHNNHHADQRSAAHGHRWWELDVTWLTIHTLPPSDLPGMWCASRWSPVSDRSRGLVRLVDPLPPDAAKDSRQVLGESPAVAQRRIGDPGRAARRESRPAAAGLCQPHGQLDVLARLGDGLGQSDVAQVTEAMPAGKGLAGAGDHRHAHPQGLAGGQAAAVGKGVQAMSIWLYPASSSPGAAQPNSSTRLRSTPSAGERPSIRAPTAPGRQARYLRISTSRAGSTRRRSSAHTATTPA